MNIIKYPAVIELAIEIENGQYAIAFVLRNVPVYFLWYGLHKRNGKKALQPTATNTHTCLIVHF